MEEVAYAKVNLALHVRARQPDGYHAIETLFAFLEDGDRLTAKEGEQLSLEVDGPFAAELGSGADNLVMRAAEALQRRTKVRRGARLRLDKRLPVASGIGGGSADAAAALRLLARWWDLPVDAELLSEIASELGADVPACVASSLARGDGRGDRLTPLRDPELAGAPILLVNPGVALGTAPVFGGWDGVDRGALPDAPPFAAARQGRNDLESPARRLVPQIGTVLDRLAAAEGSVLVRMSGSGATCFALFADETLRDREKKILAAEEPSWWLLASRLRDAGADGQR